MKLIFVVSNVILFQMVSLSQELADREYGVGIASISSPYEINLTFYSEPDSFIEPVARFRADSLVFLKEKKVVRSYDKMIEISYSEIGFPILSFSSDSTWVKVSLDCHDLKNKRFGWLSTKSSGLRIQSWSNILNNSDALFFLRPEWIAFYSEPKPESLVNPQLVEGSYQLYRLQIEGRWMQVELETPSTLCQSAEEVQKKYGVKPTKRMFWIQFLNE